MKVVNLVGRGRRPLEQGESNMAENAMLRLACSEIFSRHKAEIGGGSTEGKAVTFVVSSDARKPCATRNASFEVVDVGHLHISLGCLIMIAVLIKPGNRKRT